MFVRDLLWNSLASAPPTFWRGLTWLGDSALLLPAAFFIALWLGVPARTRGSGLLWVLCFGLASSVVLISKLAFIGWGVGSAALNFTGFSGHTTFAASVWPVMLWLLGARSPQPLRRGLIVLGWVLAGIVGISRLAVYAHSTSEVIAGFLLGTLTSTSFFMLRRGLPLSTLHGALIFASLLLPLAVQRPGEPAPTQSALEAIAMRLAGTDRPYTREDLLRRPR